MKFIADFHIHSHYSRATSKQLTPEYLDLYGRKKGVQVIGTGDFTHPEWLAELQEKLEPAEPGLFKLKKNYQMATNIPGQQPVRFILSAEISNIYKKFGKVRKVHNVIVSPDFETVEKINQKLEDLGGNLKSDGRPILGLDSRDLLEIALNANDNIFFIPAHIWTPWFSALGAKSGFNSIEECYGDLTKYIHAVETGLSTDPAMNWMVSSLDKFTLLSDSDAHSPDKLGRNANWFDTEMSYQAIFEAVKNGGTDSFLGTIDMYPQEGKYHYDGHRKCNVCLDPVETIEQGGVCPVCGKQLTEGVMNRVSQLSDRTQLNKRKNRKPFYSIIPVREILGEILSVGPNSKKVEKTYEEVLRTFGSEMDILLELSTDEISSNGYPLLSEAVSRMRQRKVYISEGYDGEYGKITVFLPGELREMNAGESLFGSSETKITAPESRPLLNFDLGALQQLHYAVKITQQPQVAEEARDYSRQFSKGVLAQLNKEQERAAVFHQNHAMVLAGPGTGKTKTLASHVYYLIEHEKTDPAKIAAITFTNKSATELKARIAQMLELSQADLKSFTGTFHALGYHILNSHYQYAGRNAGFMLIDPVEAATILMQIAGISKRNAKSAREQISAYKQLITKALDDNVAYIFGLYETYLQQNNLFDLDDLLYQPVQIFENHSYIREQWQQNFAHILVDEYQDTNPVQYALLNRLMGRETTLLYAVGDPNQAIYGFRGASVKYMRRFKADFPDAEVFRLRQSYRCSNTILASSAGILSGQSNMLEGLQEGVKVKISRYATDAAEAEGIARAIENLTGGTGFFSYDSQVTDGTDASQETGFRDIAILLRTRRQAETFRKALRNHNIPFQETDELPFWRTKGWQRLINMMTYSLQPLAFLENNFSSQEKMLVKQLNGNSQASDVLNYLFENLHDEFELKESEHRKLQNLAKDITVRSFIDRLKTGSGTDGYDEQMEAVQLMTMHASKGLEFDTVFIPGLEDGLLPFHLYRPETDREEEERLLYVAMTRARSNLYLSHAHQRYIFNRSQQLKASPFLKRIDKELTERITARKQHKKPSDGRQMKLF